MISKNDWYKILTTFGLVLCIFPIGLQIQTDYRLRDGQSVIFTDALGNKIYNTYYPGDRDVGIMLFHGMGEDLYDCLLSENKNLRCRIYAPVGGHQYLLAYLVRRLLENGANTSFVNQVVGNETSIEDLIANPIEKLSALHSKPHPKITCGKFTCRI